MKLSKIKNFISAGRFSNYWPLGLIFLLIFIFFWKVWLKGFLPLPADTIVGMYHPWRDLYADSYPQGIPFKNFLVTDPVRQLYPWRWLAIESFKSGKLPQWNPYSFAGTPLLANFQSAVFYPLNFLFFPPAGGFDFAISWGVLIFLQPLLAGLFLYLYLRQLKLSPIPSLVGGLSFAFSGFFIAWLEWGTVLHSALWLPLIFLAIEKIFAVEKQKLWAGVFTFSLICSFLAGHLQVFFYLALFSLIYIAWRFFQVKSRRRKLILLFVICYLLFVIVASVQWRPTLQFIKLSARGVDQAGWQQEGWFIPWQNLVQFLVPDFFGNPSTLNYWGTWNYGEFIGYIGVIPLFFALAAIFTFGGRRVRFFTFVCLLALSFALPTLWAKLPYHWQIPLISTSQPTRLLLIVDFCLAILAAFGLEAVFQKKRKFNFLIFPFLVFVFLWLLVIGGKSFWPDASWVDNLKISQRNLILPSGLFLAGSGLIWLLGRKKLPKNIILAFLLFLIFFDWLRFGWKFTPFTKKDWLFPPTRVIDFLKQDKEVFRIMTTDRRLFPPNFELIYKIQTINGYDPLYLIRYGELIAASERGEPNISPPFGFNRIITPQNYQTKLVDLLNVKYILSLADLDSPRLDLLFQEGETRVYQNKAVFPRAFLVYDYRVAKTKNEAINFLFEPKIDLKKTAVLEEEIDLAPTDRLIENQVRIVDYQPNLVKLEVVSKQLGILILGDNFYPGWRAFLGNEKKSQRIFRVNYTLRGIIVPEGKHQVEFRLGL